MQQAIMVNALGQIISEHREDNTVDMAKLGRQSIERFSEVLHSETLQRWYVVFRDAAPQSYHGTLLSMGLAEDAQVPAGLYEAHVVPELGRDPVPTFARYSDAVTAERLVLRLMMERGEFNE